MPASHHTTLVKSKKLRLRNFFKSVSDETENAVTLMRSCVSKFNERMMLVFDCNDENFFELYNGLKCDFEKYQEDLFLFLASFDITEEGDPTSDQNAICNEVSPVLLSPHRQFQLESDTPKVEPNVNCTVLPSKMPVASSELYFSAHPSITEESTPSLSSATTYEECQTLPEPCQNPSQYVEHHDSSLHSSDSHLRYSSQTEDDDVGPSPIYSNFSSNPRYPDPFEQEVADAAAIVEPSIAPCTFSVPSAVSAILTNITNPGDFWMQLVNVEIQKLRLPVSLFLEAEYLSSVHPGTFCLAPFQSSHFYYRAKVLTEVSVNQEIEVLFIDDGYSQTLSVHNLRRLPEKLYEIPAQAFHCFLADVSPSDGVWTNTSVSKLKEFQSNSLTVHLKSFNCGTYGVQLTATAMFSEFSCDVGETLCVYRLAFQTEVQPNEQDLSDNVIYNHISCDSGVSVTSNQQNNAEAIFSSSSGSCRSSECETSPKRLYASFEPKRMHSTSDLRDLMSFDSLEAVSTRKKSNQRQSASSLYKCSRTSECECNLHLAVPPLSVSCVEKDKMLVMLSHIVSPSEFYVNLAMSDSAFLDELQERMNSTYTSQNIPPVDSEDLRVGMFLAGHFKQDGKWYRIKMLKLNSVSERNCDVAVQYVDYGDKALLKCTDLRPLLPQFTKHPAFAIQCSLVGIAPKGQEAEGKHKQWSEAATDKFRQLVSFDRCLTAEIFDSASAAFNEVSTNSAPLEVLLWDNEGTSDILVNRVLVEFDLAEISTAAIQSGDTNGNMEPNSDVEQLGDWDPMKDVYNSIGNSYGVHVEDGQIATTGYKPKDEEYTCKYFSLRGYCPRGANCNYLHVPLIECGVTRDQVEDYATLRTPALPLVSTYVIVQVSAVINPGHFYCILPFGSKSVNEIDSIVTSGYIDHPWPKEESKELFEELNKYYSDAPFSENTALALSYGSIVVAKRNIDQSWHRGKVIEISDVAGPAKIFFVDFGDEAWVQRFSIRSILPEYLHTPFQAVECHLSDVEPLGSDCGRKWTPHAHSRFKELVSKEVLLAHITRMCGDTLHLTLRLTREDDHQSISDALIREGFAQQSTVWKPGEGKENRFVPG